MHNLLVVDNPLLKRDLTILRRKDTPHGTFRAKLNDAASILAYEAMRAMPVRTVAIETPLERTEGYLLADTVVVVPILRAGLGMVDGFVRFVPEARIGHLGMYRDQTTRRPIDYYKNIPSGLHGARVFLVDPMLATGGSAIEAINLLKAEGAHAISFVCLVAAPEGVDAMARAHPDVPIVCAALDRCLDVNAYIRPGLGDAGDRIFGTDH